MYFQVTFDFPAVALPRVTEIIQMKFSQPSMLSDAAATATVLGDKRKREVAGKYFERDTSTQSFQVMSLWDI